MSYTQTTELDLDKAVPGSNQPFETSSINANWDKVDAAVAVNNTDIAALKAGTAIVTVDGGTA